MASRRTDQPVHEAACIDVTTLAAILDSDPGSRDAPGWFGRTPLQAAAAAGRGACVGLLLNRGADPDIRDGLHGQTALHAAVNADSVDCVRRLIGAGASVDAADNRGETPIFYARSRTVLDDVVAAGARCDVVSARGRHPFQYCAAYVRSIDVMAFWLDHDIPVNHVPPFGWPALHALVGMPGHVGRAADYDRDARIARMLLARGADVDLADHRGNLPLYDSCLNRHEPIAVLLLEAGAQVNRVTRAGRTALHAAVFRGQRDLVRLLLEHGADVNIADRHRHTAYDLAAGDSETQQLLAPTYRRREYPLPTRDTVTARLRAIPSFRDVTLRGCTEEEIAELERHLDLPLPPAYREFLRCMGHGAGRFLASDHWLFRINDVYNLVGEPEHRRWSELPENSVVFAERNGCLGLFFIADGLDDNPPVYLFDDGPDRSYSQFSRSVWEFVDSLVADYEIAEGRAAS